jgi:hypothetical protein
MTIILKAKNKRKYSLNQNVYENSLFENKLIKKSQNIIENR